ncbi:hypothetical protein INT47_005818 [Mucor saturninus]|uniref:Uncharacterized protein n=1 Tax=Mucor saturninus TaxID=64648 RepID=A0A8H7V088_9FUNG|nr:hypothetical protein INT47_005818 [Mucor saturninus]
MDGIGSSVRHRAERLVMESSGNLSPLQSLKSSFEYLVLPQRSAPEAELLMKLNELLAEQEEVTRILKNEHVGLITVKPEDSIKNALFKINTN